MRSAAALGLAGLFVAVPAQGASDSTVLFGRGWVSAAVLKDGARHPLFEGTKIHVNFDHRSGYDVVRWRAACNASGARVEVTEERLVLGQGEETAIACPQRRTRQDRWMARFFDSNPKWRVGREGRLKLIAGDRVIRLRRP